MVIQFLFGGDETVLQLASGSGCLSLSILKIPIIHFQMVNLMVYELYASGFFGGVLFLI